MSCMHNWDCIDRTTSVINKAHWSNNVKVYYYNQWDDIIQAEQILIVCVYISDCIWHLGESGNH